MGSNNQLGARIVMSNKNFEDAKAVFDKYDEYLPDELVRKEFARSILDIKEMRKCVNELR